MSTTFTLAASTNVGTLASPITISSLQLTEFAYSSTPALATLGSGTLSVTLTDPSSGGQESVSYQDESVLTMWETIGDTISQAVFAKLIADGKLPDGTLTTVSDTTTTLAASSASAVSGTEITFTATLAASDGTPTGDVTFLDGETTLATVTPSSGVAIYSTSALAVGSHSITASLAATTGFSASTSSAVTVVITDAS